MTGIAIKERCPRCFGIWQRPLPLERPDSLMVALGLDRTERLATSASLCEGCAINE